MNREIKFRAWDWERVIQSFAHIWDNWRMYTIFEQTPDKKYIPMQYTWLKDKNWKEIYEGDIVKWWVYYDFDDWIWIVKFWKHEVDTSWYEYSTQTNYWFYVECWEYLKKVWRLEYIARTFHPNEIEAIWNIYENPELLK